MVYAKILGISYDAVENPNWGKFQQKKTFFALVQGILWRNLVGKKSFNFHNKQPD
jgi:hypothetical protein